MKPLTVTISPFWAERVRDVARCQGTTYRSLVEACIQHALLSGGQVVLEPFGNGKGGDAKKGVDSQAGKA